MTPLHDITDLEDIQRMVDAFYEQIRADELLGPIFNGVIGDKWPQHLAKMYTFWQTILLGEHTYHGSPFPPHAKLPVEKKHFDQWRLLFHQTVQSNFAGPKADEARWRADKMAEMFLLKIRFYQKNYTNGKS